MNKKDFVDQSYRRKWDKAEYEALAAKRAAGLLGDDETEQRAAARRVAPDKALTLSARSTAGITNALDSNTNKALLSTAAKSSSSASSAVSAAGVAAADYAFYCDACGRGFADSSSWLDHINSPAHLERTGTATGVVRASVSDVKAKLKELKKRKNEQKDDAIDHAERIRQLEQSEEERKEEAKRRRKAEKEAKRLEEEAAAKAAVLEGAEDEEQVEDLLAMGFPMSFGGGNSKK